MYVLDLYFVVGNLVDILWFNIMLYFYIVCFWENVIDYVFYRDILKIKLRYYYDIFNVNFKFIFFIEIDFDNKGIFKYFDYVKIY